MAARFKPLTTKFEDRSSFPETYLLYGETQLQQIVL